MSPVDPRVAWRKAVRRAVGRPFGMLLIYQLIFYVVNLVCSVALSVAASLRLGRAAQLGALDLVGMEQELYRGLLRATGMLSLVSVAAGMLFIVLARRREIATRAFWDGEPGRRTMRPAWLAVFIGLIVSVQGVQLLVSFVFAMMGVTLQSPTSDAINEAATTVTMWLYIGLVGPVAEEIVFRGVLLRALKPLGRNFAIFTSSLAFALFHGDVVQGLFAFGMGLILGFVAMEYSLKWAIVLHVFNNAILGGVLSLVAEQLGPIGNGVYVLALMVGGVAALIAVMVKYGDGLREYRRAYRSAPGLYVGWSSGCFIAFCTINGLIAFSSFVLAMAV